MTVKTRHNRQTCRNSSLPPNKQTVILLEHLLTYQTIDYSETLSIATMPFYAQNTKKS